MFSIYLVYNFRQFLNTYYLIAIVLCIFFIEFYMYALNSRTILEMPFLFRIAFPFRALLLPFLWYYIWSMLHPHQKIQPLQLLHFIIPLLVIVFLVPDFLQSHEYKIEIFRQFYLHNNALMNKPAGLIPAGLMQPFLLIYGIAYSLYSFYYIHFFVKQKGVVFIKNNQIVVRWLKLVATTISIFILLQTLQYLSLFYSGNFNSIAQIGQSTSLIIMKAYFLLNPLVKENMDGCIDSKPGINTAGVPIKKLLPTPVAKDLNDQTFTDIHAYFFIRKEYLNPELTISKISIDLGMNKNKLSGLIQAYYHTSFSELVNRLRINYFVELVKTNKNLTMETLIYESGFIHRSTFYAAFKKHIGINPTTYLKEQHSFPNN